MEYNFKIGDYTFKKGKNIFEWNSSRFENKTNSMNSVKHVFGGGVHLSTGFIFNKQFFLTFFF